jgi:hypothetical protein
MLTELQHLKDGGTNPRYSSQLRRMLVSSGLSGINIDEVSSKISAIS